MNDKNDDKSKESAEQLIPSFVGLYVRKADEKMVKIIEINSETIQTSVERRLCNFFKCTKSLINNVNSDENAVKCFATRNTKINFFKHLNESHPNDELYCVYCYPNPEEKTCIKYYSHRYLIKHMLKRHRFRIFQCNQCLFRAITEDHVNIHQKITHESLYTKTINNELIGDENTCKIFKCLPINSDNSATNLYYYYKKFKTNRFNDGNNETLFQCLYCDFMCEHIERVVEHCVQRHLDYPIMFFIPEPQISTTSRAFESLKFSTISDNTVVESVKPKTEPQDNSVSTTSPLKIANKIDESVVNLRESIDENKDGINCKESPLKRKLLSPECENAVNNAIKKLKAIESSFKSDFGIDFNGMRAENGLQLSESLKSVVNNISVVCAQNVEDLETNNQSTEEENKSNDNLDNNKLSDNSNENSELKLICLFCDELFIDKKEAKTHFESHFLELNQAIDDYSVTKRVQQWIQQFLLKQSQLASYENTSKLNESNAHYRCPLCVKLSLITKRIAKQYRSFSEVKTHLWQHCCWLSVKCKVCNVFLPNSDSVIAKHIKDCHHLLLSLPKNENLKFLLENKPEIDFTADQRLELEECFISIVSDRVIDPFINRLLIKMKDECEEQLRVIHNCHRFDIKVIVNQLPKLDFENKNMVKNYLKYWERNEKLRKVIEFKKKMTDENFDEIVVPKKKSKFSNDNDFEVNDSEQCFVSNECQKESDCQKSNDFQAISFDNNKDHNNEDMNSFGKQIEKVYDKVIGFDISDKNVDKSVELQNEKHVKTLNSITECVPSTSRQNSCEAMTSAINESEIRVDNNSVQNDNTLDDNEYYRISCYHCNDKFKNLKEYREHHQKQHKRLVMRCFGKERKERIRP